MAEEIHINKKMQYISKNDNKKMCGKLNRLMYITIEEETYESSDSGRRIWNAHQ